MAKKRTKPNRLRFDRKRKCYVGPWKMGEETMAIHVWTEGNDKSALKEIEKELDGLEGNWDEVWSMIVSDAEQELRKLKWLKKSEPLLKDALKIFSFDVYAEEFAVTTFYTVGIEAGSILREEDYISFDSDFSNSFRSIQIDSLI